MRAMYKKWVTSKRLGREPVCVCVCVFVSPSKWAELVISSQQQEMWEQVQLLFPHWLQGNSSHLLCLRLSRSAAVQRTTSKCVLLFPSVVWHNRTYSFLCPPPLLTWCDCFAVVMQRCKKLAGDNNWDKSYALIITSSDNHIVILSCKTLRL